MPKRNKQRPKQHTTQFITTCGLGLSARHLDMSHVIEGELKGPQDPDPKRSSLKVAVVGGIHQEGVVRVSLVQLCSRIDQQLEGVQVIAHPSQIQRALPMRVLGVDMAICVSVSRGGKKGRDDLNVTLLAAQQHQHLFSSRAEFVFSHTLPCPVVCDQFRQARCLRQRTAAPVSFPCTLHDDARHQLRQECVWKEAALVPFCAASKIAVAPPGPL